jgi:hypothetical protein
MVGTSALFARRFAVYPGYVTSKTDGDRHWIGFGRLCELYRVPPSMCVDMSDERKTLGLRTEGMIALRPRYHGDYDLTATEKGRCPMDTNGDGDCHRCRGRGCDWANDEMTRPHQTKGNDHE